MNKLTLTLFLALICTVGFAQVLQIDSLPPQGILLDKGWKWHAGDNPDFAKTDFDDSKWESIDPTKDIHDFPMLFDSKVRWLRLNFEVIQSPFQVLGLSVNQAGASEIYLNGKRIQTIGNIATDQIKAQDPLEYPFYIPIDSAGKYQLSVRYALQPNIHYTRVYGWTQNSLFRAKVVYLVPTQNIQREFRVYYTGLEIFKIGVLFMLFVLHLAFYFYQKNNKTHLFISLYFLGALLQYVFKIIGQNHLSVEARYYFINASFWASGLGQLFATTAFYQLTKVRIDFYYVIMIFTLMVMLLISSLTYGMLWGTLALLNAIVTFFITLRLTIIGLKKEIKGFNILGVAVMLSSLGFLFIELLNNNVPISPYVVDLFFNLSALSIPVGLSLFMGLEASHRNKELRSKLIENERLKNHTIAQEQEKQQILATQNETLEKQVEARTAELKASQNQLIQKEKLASLGELTAGIAHEIQNPLNFVNNFSEVSAELVKEMQEELNKGDTEEAKAIGDDIKLNLEKINLHGKRASSIVKGMLEHSRQSTGERTLTDINQLADEYLRLSYHGLRAKDKDFNAELITDFDENLPKIKVIPQDMGRVLLNLINNAFWAVNERSKKGEDGYEPKVSVSTQLSADGQVLIAIKDNGTGMSDATKAKIFQPFFTTKPTGQGTGLGLSLAYDIITKGHGGTIEVESLQGEGTTFIVKLPIQNT